MGLLLLSHCHILGKDIVIVEVTVGVHFYHPFLVLTSSCIDRRNPVWSILVQNALLPDVMADFIPPDS